jgi:hypothetical protein
MGKCFVNAKWAKDGFLHLWIDGKLRSSYYGDTMSDATSSRFKFGPYRYDMTQATDSGLKFRILKLDIPMLVKLINVKIYGVAVLK